MTTITADISNLSADGLVAASGSLRVRLLYPIVGEDVVTLSSFTVTLEDGAASFVLEPSATGNAYVIKPFGLDGLPMWCVKVPDVESISLSDLVLEHSVDPATVAGEGEDPEPE